MYRPFYSFYVVTDHTLTSQYQTIFPNLSDLLFGRHRLIGQRKVNITNYLPIITNINYNIPHRGRKARKARTRTFCLVKQRRSSDWFTVIKYFSRAFVVIYKTKLNDRIEHNRLISWIIHINNKRKDMPFLKQHSSINRCRHTCLYLQIEMWFKIDAVTVRAISSTVLWLFRTIKFIIYDCYRYLYNK